MKNKSSFSFGTRFRQSLSESRRIVVKVGSKVLVNAKGEPDAACIRRLARQIAALCRNKVQVVLVSSGAIAAGMRAFEMAERPDAVPDLQMCAAVGQVRLMRLYHDAFAKEGITIGQVLLTHDDFVRKLSVANMRRTMDDLLRHGVVPIVNENDVVADEEVKAFMTLGDNDHLASLIALQTRSDLLVMLSAVDGLRRPRENGTDTERIPFVEKIDRTVTALVRPPDAGAISKGGMDSKLKCAKACMQAGCNVVIADGCRKDVLTRIYAGEDEGTLFAAAPL